MRGGLDVGVRLASFAGSGFRPWREGAGLTASSGGDVDAEEDGANM
jgi:hypothetical protein